MKTFLIHVLDRNTFESYDRECCTGEIQIGSFKETFEMPLDFWTIDDYERQWKEGIARLKTHDQSCLVSELQDPIKAPWLMMWVLYKEGEVVYIRNNLVFKNRIIKALKKHPFTAETCYSFIIPRLPSTDKEHKVSEWVVDLRDILPD